MVRAAAATARGSDCGVTSTYTIVIEGTRADIG